MRAILWEEARECGVCGSRAWRPTRSVCQRRYAVCLECDVHRLYDRVVEDRLDLLYTGYYPADPSPADLDEQLENPTFGHRRVRLEACRGDRERRILEIGCGDGNFLAVLRRSGWHVCGVEFGADAAQLVRRRHAIRVFVGDIADVSPPEGPFPVVAGYHVLEHIYHPAAWLRRVRQLIEPSGLLHLQVPNRASLTEWLTRQAWASLVFPEHVYFYTPETLGLLLARSGFSVLSLTTWDPWHGPGTVSRSLANLARRMATGRLPWSDRFDACPGHATGVAPTIAKPHPFRALARRLLETASLPLARVEAAVGRGAVVDIVARRIDSPAETPPDR